MLHNPVISPFSAIIPTPLRLGADPRFTGKGVTICFIDSGFYPHPDLVATRNRIKLMLDITEPSRCHSYFMQPHKSSWHGTMTSVVAAGDGYCSEGLYKGIANDADVVLLKVQNDNGQITTQNIVLALEWVLQHHRQFNIGIVNMSLGDDFPLSYRESKVDQLAEALFEQNITIVAAVGNDEHASIKPPANSPHVIAVGGIDDHNCYNDACVELYHSSYGATADGLMKPELVAHAMWIPAPILPGTEEKMQAEKLYSEMPVTDILSEKYIHPAYMHVDGTSFAAPIVSSVIAQMLEVAPLLTATQIRQILFSTAKRLKNLPVERQGFGYVHARKAIVQALKTHSDNMQASPQINMNKRTIQFSVNHQCASHISLAGSFNDWAKNVLLMEPGRDGLWTIEIPMLPSGKHAYKFFVDEQGWVEDVSNPYREPDGLNGWNSVLHVQ
jgi:serine protease AprX